MFLIAGGPGQGSANAFGLGTRENAAFMRTMLPGYTLVAFDNRGTGDSGVINCPALQSSGFVTAEAGAALARDCATIIGPQREFYSTRDHAEDIDAVRAALDVSRIALFGVSYGTKLSLWYALAHPGNVERLLLDSVVPPQFPDPFERNVLSQIPRALRGFCSGGFCRGATTNFAGDAAALANQLQARPIEGKVIIPSGAVRAVGMNGEKFLSMLIDTDLSPGLAAEMPAAVRAARAGYTRPLLRLFDLNQRANRLAAEDLSFGLYAATNCADGRFPWAPGTPPDRRRALVEATIAGFPDGVLGPFGDWAARLGTAYFCEQWPSPAGNAPIGAGPFPNVPVLAVNGAFDLRTPTANALAVIDQFPQGRLLEVPGVGHSVLTADLSGCSFLYVREWIRGTLVAPTRAVCRARVPPLVKVLSAFPRRVARPAVRSTLSVVGKALREAEATWLQVIFAPTRFSPRGLYGGRLVPARGVSGFTLRRYSIAPGVFVSGKVTRTGWGPPSTYRGTVRVSGSAVVAGTLRFSGNSVTGTLGGRRVKATH
jgi:pimeloyl-ACP methyl ester carboxylesterase